MQAYLIDPFAQTVTEVDYSGDIADIYKLTDCETFAVAQFDARGNGVFVDDEGLLNNKPKAFFQIWDYPQPLAGKGLVLGTDDEGESIAPTLTLAELRAKVRFMSLEDVQRRVDRGAF